MSPSLRSILFGIRLNALANGILEASLNSPESSLQTLEGYGIDVQNFPVIRMRVGTGGALKNWLAGMSALLDQRVPFAIIIEGRPHDEDDAIRRERNLWFKREMVSFQKYCRGFVQIEPDPTKRAGQEAHARKMSDAFSMPMQIVANDDDALTVARSFFDA